MIQITLREQLLDAAIDVEIAVAADFATFVDSRTEALVNAVCNNDAKKVASILRSFAKYQPRRQERLLDSDGTPAISYTAERVLVRDHFSGVLHGRITLLQDVLNLDRAAAVSNAAKHADVCCSSN